MGSYSPVWTITATRGQRLFGWSGIVANALLILWLMLWLGRHNAEVSVGLGGLTLTIASALFLADWFSGFVHWLTDTWFDEVYLNRIISIAREHHLYPRQIVGYGVRDYVAYSSWPNVAVVGPVAAMLTLIAKPIPAVFAGVIVCLVISLVMVFGTYAHRLGHQKTRSRILTTLQNFGFLITPSYHAVHHRGNHDIRYCVINGWANPLCDCIRFWRGLEWIVERVTGAIPRENDHEWFDRFERDPNFRSARHAGGK
jgi:ubiquitin-conjugating enzyme E2 variant